MRKSTKVVGSISRRAKFNILSAVFIAFIAFIVITSINPLFELINQRKEMDQLESKLNWIREENIKLLASEKELYGEDALKKEALKQFNIADSRDKIVFSIEEQSFDNLMDLDIDLDSNTVYSNNDLWENIKIFYNKEFQNN